MLSVVVLITTTALILLNPNLPFFANSVDPDQLASEEYIIYPLKREIEKICQVSVMLGLC